VHDTAFARRSLRPFLAALLLLFASPVAAGDGRWRVLVQGGQASAPRSVRFAELAGIALARDFPLTGRLGASVELYPLLVVNQTRPDFVTRERVGAMSLGGLLTFDVGRRGAWWSLRLEGGAGAFWGFAPIPAAGSRFNFLDQGGARLLARLGNGGTVSAGYRRVHISNLGLAGDRNPGLSLHQLVLAYGW
jgi:hypothetical protein